MNVQKIPNPTTDRAAAFSIRHWRGEADLPIIANVINTSMAADEIDIVRSVDELRSFLEHWPNLDPGQDTFLVELDDEVIAYGDTSWNDEHAGGRTYRADMYVLPAYRDTDVPERLFHSLLSRLQALASRHPGIDDQHFHMMLAEGEERLMALFEDHGFKRARTFFRMVRDSLEGIPDLPMPQGIEVRAVEPGHYRAIYAAMKEAFRDHWGTQPPSEEGYEFWINDPLADPALWQVAWDGDQVAGMVLNFIDHDENRRYDRSRGYTEDICVRRPWRRRGLAKALIARSLRVIADAGMAEAALGVDADNDSGALTLYEDLGYRVQWKMFAYRRPFASPE
jgi:mycothiol synthase